MGKTIFQPENPFVYVNNSRDRDIFGSNDELILIDGIDLEISKIIKNAYHESFGNNIDWTNENILVENASKMSKILHENLPFLDFKSAADYISNVSAPLESFKNYMETFSSGKPVGLRYLSGNNKLNCAGHSLNIPLSIGADWKAYNEAFNMKGVKISDAHTVVAKKVGNKYLIIDSTNGPLKEKKRSPRDTYLKTLKEFHQTYMPAKIYQGYLK